MSKNLTKITILVLLAAITYACKTITPVTNALYVGEREGTITLRSEGVDDTEEKSQIAAEQNAFNTLLFRGIPGSSQKVPLIDFDETGIKSRYHSYFNEFFGKQRRYRTFVTQSQIAGEASKRLVTVEITINLRALRSDLEQNGILRKFGY
ncbi:MAG: hypothetical protein LBC98_09025 [Prevotellaceae bacterium]|jgi:uncharacterized protein YpmS|nr:hypothetical protein [Prevotellaceae bacterium]